MNLFMYCFSLVLRVLIFDKVNYKEINLEIFMMVIIFYGLLGLFYICCICENFFIE